MENTKGKILVIAEKPSMGKDIAKVIEPDGKSENGYIVGNKYVITWAIGHLVGLSSPKAFCENPWDISNLPILPQKFKYDIPTESGKKKQFFLIKSLIENCSSIINACDAGREGEAIFRYIVFETVGNQKPVQRLWINSLTNKAIQEGFNNLKPLSNYDNLYNSALGRDRADWIIGMGVGTPAVSYKVKGAIPDPNIKWISVGRVFTPTFAMVCKRHLENTNFKPEPFFQLKAHHNKESKDFIMTSIDNFATKEQALSKLESIRLNPSFLVKDVEKKETKQNPNLLFDLTSLQQEANKKYSFSADKTLKTAQSLYEAKIITYPRTDSKYINEDIFPEIPSLLQKHLSSIDLFSDNIQNAKAYLLELISQKKLNKRSVDGSKVSDHHAIIPTENSFNSNDKDQEKLYSLILKRTYEAFSEACVKDVTTILAESSDTEFNVKGSIIKYEGFKIFTLTKNDEDQSEQDQDADLPNISQGETLNSKLVELAEKFTKPKPLYNEATLLSAMENCGKELEDEELKKIMKGSGIGTPATRASIIEKLFSQNMVERKGKTLIPTTIGLWLYSYIKDLGVASPEMTGDWEFKLEQVKNGDLTLSKFEAEVKAYAQILTQEILNLNVKASKEMQAELDANTHKCPKCQKGTMIKGQKSWQCNRWNAEDTPCDFTVWAIIGGKKVTEKQFSQLMKNGQTDLIKDFKSVNKETKAEKIFDAMLIINKDFKLAYKFNKNETLKTDYKCLKCKEGNINKSDKAWACDKWNAETNPCDFKIWATISGIKLSDKNIIDLLTTKKTDLIKGFKYIDKITEKQKIFDAFLTINESLDIKFDFPKREVKVFSSTAIKCPKCQKGNLIDNEKGVSCSEWKTGCKFTIWKNFRNKILSTKEIEQLAINHKTASRVTGMKTKAGKTFSSILIIDENFVVTLPPKS